MLPVRWIEIHGKIALAVQYRCIERPVLKYCVTIDSQIAQQKDPLSESGAFFIASITSCEKSSTYTRNLLL